MNTRLRVGVLRGGPSNEYEVSLKSGKYVLDQLRKRPNRFEPVDILIARDGSWHHRGLAVNPHDILLHVDVVFNALHGAYGEDGQVQRFLERIGMPFTGSKSVASAIAMQKHIAKDVFEREGIDTPLHIVLDPSTDDVAGALSKITSEFPSPWVVKPASSGSSVGISLVSSKDALKDAVGFALEHSPKVMIEEYIAGREGTVGVIDGFRGEDYYVCLPVEIIHAKGRDFFDYDAKYSGKSEEISPGRFSEGEKTRMQDLARAVHQALDLSHYSRTDFRIAEDGRIYVLEANTLPGLTEESLLPKSLSALGIDHADFIDHLIMLAFRR